MDKNTYKFLNFIFSINRQINIGKKITIMEKPPVNHSLETKREIEVGECVQLISQESSNQSWSEDGPDVGCSNLLYPSFSVLTLAAK